MQRTPNLRDPSLPRGRLPRFASSLTLALTLSAAGCLSSSLQKRSAALAAANAPIADQAAAAYHAANDLYALRVDYDAVDYFDRPPTYNPRDTGPLLSDKDIDRRLAVLEAFQCYVRTLGEIANGVSSPALDVASQSVGSSLSTLGNDLAPTIETTFGLAVPTGSAIQTVVATTTGNVTTTVTKATHAAPPNPITQETRNGIATAANALGRFLASRTLKRELPGKIQAMDMYLQTLCTLLEDDIDVLQYEEQLDYDSIIDRETLFIRENPSTLNPQQRRERIMLLPAIVRRRQNSGQQLIRLRAAIAHLAQTHATLAADVQHNPASLKDKLTDLAAAGSNLGTFYSSLPAK